MHLASSLMLPDAADGKAIARVPTSEKATFEEAAAPSLTEELDEWLLPGQPGMRAFGALGGDDDDGDDDD